MSGFAASGEGLKAAERESALARRFTRWGLAVAASALVLVVAAVATVALWLAASGTRSTEYLAAAGVSRIEVDVGDGDVQVVGGGLDEVAVRRTDRYAFDHHPSEWRTLENDVVRISSRCPSLVIGSCSSDYRLTVADNVPLTIRVERGDVRLTGYRGSAVLESRSGSIVVDGFCGFVLQATTKAGSIDARTACPAERLELRTDTGHVHAIVPSGRYRVDAETNAGRTAIRGIVQAIEAPWAVQALSNAGDVTVEGR